MNKSTFNKHQKWTALLVTVTFAWLLQVWAMPLAAADTTEKVAAASLEQAPGFIEQEGSELTQARKRNPVHNIIFSLITFGVILCLVAFIEWCRQ
jgi:hypothetical protein